MPDYNNSNGYGPRNYGNQTRMDAREEASEVFAKKDFQKVWIEKGADEALPDYAEFIGKRWQKRISPVRRYAASMER